MTEIKVHTIASLRKPIIDAILALPLIAYWIVCLIMYPNEYQRLADNLFAEHPILFTFLLAAASGLLFFMQGNDIKKDRQNKIKTTAYDKYRLVILSGFFAGSFYMFIISIIKAL
jgi:hypothetical protein